jgi:hypothetical protein
MLKNVPNADWLSEKLKQRQFHQSELKIIKAAWIVPYGKEKTRMEAEQPILVVSIPLEFSTQ